VRLQVNEIMDSKDLSAVESTRFLMLKPSKLGVDVDSTAGGSDFSTKLELGSAICSRLCEEFLRIK